MTKASKDGGVETVFRVVRLSETARDAVKAGRSSGDNNQTVIAKAVEAQLPKLVEGLRVLGFSSANRGKSFRLPFSEDTIASLQDASAAVSIPAVQLLELCLLSTSANGRRRKGTIGSKGRKSNKRAK